ncbi:adhesion G protein-coupled receptor B2 isoform X1 [Scyliorhinus canicula]|uniref:adhesion G protein-coupled receptor B2 isoform X1 n=2 Tax=Scyliorhinus canicula TaxID=7830 RepID=UPI0018F5285C|nr:adhesion G protein-coupled receptor B2 isoform X1 [Scyliorhinus canicula]XP_038657727.1 adhesion G protein-coupled receptor B2 isoform X1 [Scyliorhinus canicula]XP_038657737.1 adhesion G protein-coupled receptor B2 isoform X1 [Scyliorhinus canicula]XP_038657746.1 adhesion G protein-coupled receptor B2 isoform X1 [Scyliorhinus canicula]
MNTAHRLILSVLLSLVLLTLGFDVSENVCSTLVSGVLYRSFSLQDIFPKALSGCSWTIENPDPTKYSIYLKFHKVKQFCSHTSLMVLQLDHYIPNQTCSTLDYIDYDAVNLCETRNLFTFLQFDKDFVQFCLTSESVLNEHLGKNAMEFQVLEVILLNNENSSQFGCGILCHWFQSCLNNKNLYEPCGINYSGCACPDMHENESDSSTTLPFIKNEFIASKLHSRNANDFNAESVAPKAGSEIKKQRKIRRQHPRSADDSGTIMAQIGDPAAEEWSQWSVCSLTCGMGWQMRTRSCVASPYGTLCSGPLRETRICNNSATCPVHGLWEEWSPWSLCSVTCGRGSRTRSRMCVAPQHGGKACQGSELQTKLCNIALCPVEGQWQQWGPWNRCSVTCSNGTQQRIRKCISTHGWTECKGHQAEARNCFNQDCSTEGKWGPWNHWSLCSKTCDSGWQRRLRMCKGTSVKGYPCEGSGEEVRTCKEKRCPAPHEMCRDDYIMAMTWKRTAAGGLVYNKCPPNATGSASRKCLLDSRGIAVWGPPSFARCVSHDYRHLHLSIREHLAKGQRMLAGEGMIQVIRTMLGLMERKNFYSGDLLFSADILRNVTDTFKRASYIPASGDIQKFFQIVSYMLEAENREKWKDALQVAPGSIYLMRVVEDFIHVVGQGLKVFQSALIVTDNLVISIQREPVSAVSSDISFPMKGRRGMKDWARNSEDKLYIPKEVFMLSSSEIDDSAYYIIGAVLYRTLGLILPVAKKSMAINSKVLAVTVRPQPTASEPIVVELSHLINGTSNPHCVVWDDSKTDSGPGSWNPQSCETVKTQAAHTICLCNQLATFAILAQKPRDSSMEFTGVPSVPLMIGCGIACMALLTLLAVYAAFWRFIKSERSIILLNFCLSIMASNILILVGQTQIHSKGVCMMTAAFLHFFFLSSFCWVLTEAWQSYLAVLGKIRTRLIRKRFLCLGWGLPALIVAISVGFTKAKGYGTANYCWLSLDGGLLYAFVGPAAIIVLVNMLIGIIVFNKLMSRDGISDKSKKQRAGQASEARSGLMLKCSKCGVVSTTALSATITSNAMASLWSSCVVLPLLALTWMSAVLAMTDRRSILFQILFAVFDSVQGFVIITVHCFLRREIQDVIKCRTGSCKTEENENSPDSYKNGQVQIMTDFEKDVDLACQSVLFKEVNTCNPATITGTLSHISLDDEEDEKLNINSEGMNFTTLPGNIPSGNVLVQLPPMHQLRNMMSGINELNEQPAKKETNSELRGTLYLCTENTLKPVDVKWRRAQEQPLEGDYMVLPRRTVSLKPFIKEDSKLNINVDDSRHNIVENQPVESEIYPNFAAVDQINININQPYGTLNHPRSVPLKQHPSVRHILASELADRSRTMPRHKPSSAGSTGSLERKRLRYSDLDFEKVMHTRKRHSELYHELNQKFHTLDRFRDPKPSGFKQEKQCSISSAEAEKSTPTEQTTPVEQSWDNFKTTASNTLHFDTQENLELHSPEWEASGSIPLDTSEGDFQTEV